MASSPRPPLGTESLTSTLVDTTFHVLPGGAECVQCDFTGGGVVAGSCGRSPLTSGPPPPAPFPSADFALYPFPVINLSFSTTIC